MAEKLHWSHLKDFFPPCVQEGPPSVLACPQELSQCESSWKTFLLSVGGGAFWGCLMLCKSNYTENRRKDSLQNVSSCVPWESKHGRKRNYILSNWMAFLQNVSACVSWDAQLFCKSICTRCIGKDFLHHNCHLEDLEILCRLLSLLSSMKGRFGKLFRHQGLMITECKTTHT